MVSVKNPKKITPIQDQNPTTTLTFTLMIQTGNGRNQQVLPVAKKCHHLATKIQNKRKRKKRENLPTAALNQQNLVKNLVRNLVIIAKKIKMQIQKGIMFVNPKTRQV